MRMNHDNHNNILDRSNSMPALLPIADPLDKRNAVRIIEDKLGGFKIDAMFLLVAPILCLIPFKSNHVYLHSRKYIVDCQETVLIYPTDSINGCSLAGILLLYRSLNLKWLVRIILEQLRS